MATEYVKELWGSPLAASANTDGEELASKNYVDTVLDNYCTIQETDDAIDAALDDISATIVDDYAKKTEVNDALELKYDTSAFSAVSGKFVSADFPRFSADLGGNAKMTINRGGILNIVDAGNIKVSEQSNVTFEFNTTLSAFHSNIVQGINNTVVGAQSMAQGISNTAANQSFAQGLNNSAATASIAQGLNNTASNYSQSFGFGNIITNTGMAIGQYNKTSADTSFVIGNGTNANNRSDLFIIKHDGTVSSIGDIISDGKSLTSVYDTVYNNSATYALSANVYNKQEIESKLDDIIAEVETIGLYPCRNDEVKANGEPDEEVLAPEGKLSTNIVYLVKDDTAPLPDQYKEWIWKGIEWDCIGDTTINLDSYALTRDVIASAVQTSAWINSTFQPTGSYIEVPAGDNVEKYYGYMADSTHTRDGWVDLASKFYTFASASNDFLKYSMIPNTIIPEDGLSAEWDSEMEELHFGVSADYSGAAVTSAIDWIEEQNYAKFNENKIISNFDLPNISNTYDFADSSVTNMTAASGACMLSHAFSIPTDHPLETLDDDPETPTLFGIYARQDFDYKVMLALYVYEFPKTSGDRGSSTYVGDTGPVYVLEGLNEYPLKNRNPSITKLENDKIYYVSLYLPNEAVNAKGLYLAGEQGYGPNSIPAIPRLSCAVEGIIWEGNELDIDDPTTTLNLYEEIEIEGETRYIYGIGPWNGGYRERPNAPRLYMQIRNAEYVPVIPPSAPFEDLGEVYPTTVIAAGALPMPEGISWSWSQSDSSFRDITPKLNCTITAFEWIDAMPTAAQWVADRCLFTAGFDTNLSDYGNTITELGKVITIDGVDGYAHRLTFATPKQLVKNTLYRILCEAFTSDSNLFSWDNPKNVVHCFNNGYYISQWSEFVRYDNMIGKYNKLYDNNGNSYVV